MSTMIYLIRHGETAGNVEVRYIGWTDIPLDTEALKGVDDWYLPPCFKRSCSISFGGGPPALSARRRKWEHWTGLK